MTIEGSESNGLRVGSLFSGIGGIDLGLERAGHTVVFQCESDEWRRKLLAERFPGVPCHEDVRAVGTTDVRLAGGGDERHELAGEVAPVDRGQARADESAVGLQDTGGVDAAGGSRVPDAVAPTETEDLRRGATAPDAAGGEVGRPRVQRPERVDLLCGGFPCQDLSVAGRRAGLMHEGGRSNLFFEFARIADELVQPGGYVLIENVPGLLSSNGGRDFGVILATLAELGFHDLAWRILDSRHFGVPQRRRRVFILGRRATGRRCAEVLLESEGREGDPTAGPEEGADVALALGAGAGASGWRGADHVTYVTASDGSGQEADISPTIDARAHDGPRRNQGGVVVASTLKGQRGKGGGGIGPEETLVADTVRSHPRPGSNSDGNIAVVANGLTQRYGKGTDSDATDTMIASGFNANFSNQGGMGDEDEAAPLTKQPHSAGVHIAAPLSHGSNPNSNAAGRRREDDENLVVGPLQTGRTPNGHGMAGVNDQAAAANHIVPSLTSRCGDTQDDQQSQQLITAFHMLQDPISEEDSTPAWGKGNKEGTASLAVAISENQRAEVLETDYSHQLTSGGGKPGQGYPAVRVDAAVRRLTPVECERLQGFPDDWTKISESTPDSRRYASLGDAVTVNVAQWIGERLRRAC